MWHWKVHARKRLHAKCPFIARHVAAWAAALALSGPYVAGSSALAASRDAHQSHLRPVQAVSHTTLTVAGGALAYYASEDLQQPQPNIRRAIIVIHGKLRNSDQYYANMHEEAAQVEGTSASREILVIAPQFLSMLDTAPNHVAPDVLRWRGNGWMAGEPAVAPSPVSSYAALDAFLKILSDRSRFPQLREVVLAGHSGGAQVVQRYAFASQAAAALTRQGIPVRFLVASPSSYLYFDEKRPVSTPDVSAPSPSEVAAGYEKTAPLSVNFEPFDGAHCPNFNDWKYGTNALSPYVRDQWAQTKEGAEKREQAYMRLDLTYLVGGNDDDPQQSALDKSCAAEAQGPQRVARAAAYQAYLHQRDNLTVAQPFYIVPGVGHNESRMFKSVCARHVLFGTAGCD